VTKQRQTRDRVLVLIDELATGAAIPSERQLSTDLGVSRLTVRAALDELVRDGFLVRRRGAGTFVSEPKIAQELTMTSFTEDMERRGLRPKSRTLELGVVPAGAQLGRLLHGDPDWFPGYLIAQPENKNPAVGRGFVVSEVALGAYAGMRSSASMGSRST
jgi:GntR family transcriptional regulator